MRLFAPLYLSNECINNCRYCGFSRDNPILRVTLDLPQVVAEGQHLAREGFRQVLLVTAVVEDSQYLQQPFVVSSQFKKEVDGSKWDPTPCTAR